MTPGSGGGGGAPGSPPSSVMFVGVSAAGRVARAREEGVRCSAGDARRGGAVGAVAALPTARGGQDFLTRSLSPRQQRSARRDQTRLVLPRFSKAASAAVPPLDVRASSRRDEPPAVRPLRPHPRRERAGRDRAARRRARTRKRGRAVSEGGGGGGGEVGEVGVVGGGTSATGLADARRAARPPPDRRRDSSVARARSSWRWSARLERSGRGRVGERDGKRPNPPRVVRETRRDE